MSDSKLHSTKNPAPAASPTPNTAQSPKPNRQFEHTRQTLDQEPVPGAMRLRFCNRCQSAVHRADSEAEFAELARQGRCVAVFLDGVDLGYVGRAHSSRYSIDTGNQD